MLSTTARYALLAAALGFAAPAFAQTDSTSTDSTSTDATSTDSTSTDATSTGTTSTDATSTDATSTTATADAGAAPDLTAVSTAVDAATTAGLLETLTSGEAYTAFVPTNTALEPVADQVPADQAALATLIQGYVVPGTVLAADAMKLVTDGGGTATVDSLAGTPITLTMDAEGDGLLVNGAAVSQPDLKLGNVTIHVLEGVYLPAPAAQ